jgi:hypothetical protein
MHEADQSLSEVGNIPEKGLERRNILTSTQSDGRFKATKPHVNTGWDSRMRL